MTEYTFDFEKADGDTIIGKYESLCGLLIEAWEERPFHTAIASREIVSIFECAPRFVQSPAPVQVGNLKFAGMSYVGKFGFACYKSDDVGQHELILLGSQGNSAIKFIGL